jgi:hypothetical protein
MVDWGTVGRDGFGSEEFAPRAHCRLQSFDILAGRPAKSDRLFVLSAQSLRGEKPRQVFPTARHFMPANLLRNIEKRPPASVCPSVEEVESRAPLQVPARPGGRI